MPRAREERAFAPSSPNGSLDIKCKRLEMFRNMDGKGNKKHRARGLVGTVTPMSIESIGGGLTRKGLEGVNGVCINTPQNGRGGGGEGKAKIYNMQGPFGRKTRLHKKGRKRGNRLSVAPIRMRIIGMQEGQKVGDNNFLGSGKGGKGLDSSETKEIMLKFKKGKKGNHSCVST